MTQILCMLGLLGVCTIEDVLRKRIHIVVLAVFAIIGLLIHLIYADGSIVDMCLGMLIGLILIAFSVLSGGKIGLGDGALVLVTGIYLGFWGNILLLWISTLLSAVFGIGACILLKKSKNYEFAFAPFLLVGYVIVLVIGSISETGGGVI